MAATTPRGIYTVQVYAMEGTKLLLLEEKEFPYGSSREIGFWLNDSESLYYVHITFSA